jgi:tryptophan-rich sensory protein
VLKPGALDPQAIGIAAAWAVGIAGIGALVTQLGPWYRGLRKPTWQPPDRLFGPAWSLIFLCAALAGVLAWSGAAATSATRRAVIIAYLVNGLLNIGWSVLFFRRRRPDLALLEVGPLWCSIVAMVIVVQRTSVPAAALLVPYLGWVAFAAVLNRTIVRLNQPFEGR